MRDSQSCIIFGLGDAFGVTNRNASCRCSRILCVLLSDRLQELLDRQDGGKRLTSAERKEAEGLVNLAELLSLLRLRTQRASNRRTKKL